MTLFWGILFLLLIFVEITTVNLVTIWLAVGSIISLLVSLFYDNLILQIVVFILASLLSLIVTKPLVNKIKVKNIEPTNSDRYIGKKGDVISKITPKDRGQVKVLGTIWTAISNEELEVGDEIVVQGIDGVKLIVSKEEK